MKDPVTARVADLLETLDGWWTITELVDEYESRWGRVLYNSVEQALFRMKGRGVCPLCRQSVLRRRSGPRTAFRRKDTE